MYNVSVCSRTAEDRDVDCLGNSRASRSAAAKIPSSTIFSRPSTVCPLGEAEVHVVFIFGCFDLIKRLKEYSQKMETKYPFPPPD